MNNLPSFIGYRLTIQVPEYNKITKKYALGEEFVIENPASIISVIKNVFSVGGVSTVKLINLDDTLIDYLTYDRYTDFVRNVGGEISSQNINGVKGVLNNGNLYPRVRIELIQDDKPYVILNGIIDEVKPPVRSGTELITTMNIIDSGFYLMVGKLSAKSIMLTKGVTLNDALTLLFKQTENYAINYSFDKIASTLKTSDLAKSYNKELKKSIPVSGRQFQEVLLNILTAYEITTYNSSNSSIVAVDDAVSFILNTDRDSYLSTVNLKNLGNVHEISDETGLMQPPVREKEHIRLEVVFNPEIKIGDRVKIDSSILSKYNLDGIWTKINNNRYNGELYVQAVQHSGNFNSPVGGQVVTVIQVFTGGIRFESRVAAN